MKSPSPSVHTGSGVPQKRSRESAQSTLLASQFPNRPSPDVLRHPVDGAVELHHAVPDAARRDVPRVLRVVDEGIAGAPSVRIVVEVALGAVHQPARLQVGDEDRVGVLEELPRHRLHLGQEAAVEPHPVHHRQALGLAEPDVVLSVGRSAVHDTGAVLDGHESRPPTPGKSARRPEGGRTGGCTASPPARRPSPASRLRARHCAAPRRPAPRQGSGSRRPNARTHSRPRGAPASARFDGRVQGVVVHTRNEVRSAPSTGNRT